MEVVLERCCGLDVHKKSVVACVIRPEGRESRRFGTTTRELISLSDWLHEAGVVDVAMESTGVYWKPVYGLLEDTFRVLVVNAQHIKAVPGRKTDVKDAEWIAELLQHGLLRGSFIPPRPQRELRELVGHRRSLVEQRSGVANRIQKILEGANIKLSSVATDVLGSSGRAMLAALAAGETDPVVLAELARGRLREKLGALHEALEGVVGSHQRFMLQSCLRQLADLDREIQAVTEEVERRVDPFEESIALLDTIPGIARRSAEVFVAAVGSDTSAFPSAGHLASWAGLCPGNRQSGEKRLRAPTRKGYAMLKQTMVEAARSAARTQTYLGAMYRRLSFRIGARRAAVAVAHRMTVIAYHILNTRQPYNDLGVDYFDTRDHEAITRRAVRRLESLGHKVVLEAA